MFLKLFEISKTKKFNKQLEKQQLEKNDSKINQKNEKKEDNDEFVNEFVEKVQYLEMEINDLLNWTNNFYISPKRKDAREMVKICNVSFFIICLFLNCFFK